MKQATVIVTGEFGPENELASLLGLQSRIQKQGDVDELLISVDSPGGSWTEGMGMYDWLRRQTFPFSMLGVGRVGSIATTFYLSAPYERREVTPHTEFFIHLPSGAFEGTADEGLAYFQDVKNKEEMMINLYVERAGVDRNWVIQKMRAQTSLTAEEAVAHGFACRIVKPVTASNDRQPVMARTFAYEERLKDGLGKKRSQMPQVPLEDLQVFANYFAAKYGADIISRLELPLSALKPSQSEFDKAKINSKARSEDWKNREYIASSQLHLLDGHHDWAAGLESDPDAKVKVLQIGMPSEQLISEANKLKMTTSEPVKKAQ